MVKHSPATAIEYSSLPDLVFEPCENSHERGYFRVSMQKGLQKVIQNVKKCSSACLGCNIGCYHPELFNTNINDAIKIVLGDDRLKHYKKVHNLGQIWDTAQSTWQIISSGYKYTAAEIKSRLQGITFLIGLACKSSQVLGNSLQNVNDLLYFLQEKIGSHKVGENLQGTNEEKRFRDLFRASKIWYNLEMQTIADDYTREKALLISSAREI